MATTIKVRWEVEELANVMTLYDEQKVYRATTETGVYSEITGPGTRVALVAGQTAYYFDDTGGETTYWYKVSYFNSSTLDESTPSDPMLGAGQGNYVTIADLRNYGLPSTVSDSEALKSIDRAEALVERLTGNFFREVEGTFVFDGTNNHMLHLPLPIISVASLTVNDQDAALAATEYEVYNGRTKPNDDRWNPKIVLKRSPAASIFQQFNFGRYLKGTNQTVVGSFGFLEPDGSVPEPVKESVIGLCLLEAGKGTMYQALLGMDGVVGAKIKERTDDHELQWSDAGKQPGRPIIPRVIYDKLMIYRAPRTIRVPEVRWSVLTGEQI